MLNYGITEMDIEEYNPSTSSDSSSDEEEAPQKKTRGRTTCANLGKKTNLRIKFNRHGHPKGKMLSKYLTYVATVTKERIPITIKNWKEVDIKLKEECWEEIKVQLRFKVKKILMNIILHLNIM